MGDIQFGARLTKSKSANFRLWAPDCDQVELLVDGEIKSMKRDHDGMFSCQVPCAAGARYRFRLDGKIVVPDPASRQQFSDVHGDSVVLDSTHNWTNQNWAGRPWPETIIYELHAGSYGGFKGIKNQLPRLADLGVTAIELMPIAEFSGKRNWGYDGVLSYAPDTVYGTPAELMDMIDYAHGLNIQVFLDVVYNHFGPDGNYLNLFASSFFRDDITTPWGKSFDFRSRHVRRFFIENALQWLIDYRFDGLRFDAIHAIRDETFLKEMAAEIRSRTMGRYVHLILENENNEADFFSADSDKPLFDAQWNDDWHHCLHVLLTGESESYYGDFQNPAVQLARCLQEGFAYQGEQSSHAGDSPRGTASAHLETTAFVDCLQNHDQIGNRAMGERLTILARPDALRAAITLLLLNPHIPMLFMGEEWGETTPFLFFTDYHDELADAVRQGRRQEFAKFAAFTDVKRRDVIPDPNDEASFLASVLEPPAKPTESQTRSIELYRFLIELRTKYIVPNLIGTKAIGAVALSPFAVRAEWSLANGNRLAIGSNFGDEGIFCRSGNQEILFSSGFQKIEVNILPPHTTLVWYSKNGQ